MFILSWSQYSHHLVFFPTPEPVWNTIILGLHSAPIKTQMNVYSLVKQWNWSSRWIHRAVMIESLEIREWHFRSEPKFFKKIKKNKSNSYKELKYWMPYKVLQATKIEKNNLKIYLLITNLITSLSVTSFIGSCCFCRTAKTKLLSQPYNLSF